MDAGYDYDPIYEQVHRMGHQSIIAYNKRNEPEPGRGALSLSSLSCGKSVAG